MRTFWNLLLAALRIKRRETLADKSRFARLVYMGLNQAHFGRKDWK